MRKSRYSFLWPGVGIMALSLPALVVSAWAAGRNTWLADAVCLWFWLLFVSLEVLGVWVICEDYKRSEKDGL